MGKISTLKMTTVVSNFGGDFLNLVAAKPDAEFCVEWNRLWKNAALKRP